MKRNNKYLVVVFLGGSIFTALTGQCAVAETCRTGVFQEPNSAVTVESPWWAEEECLATHVESAGVLLLEVALRAEGGSSGRLDLYGGDCRPAEVEYSWRGPTRLLARVPHAGAYFYCASSDTPGQPIGPFKAINGFLAQAVGKADRDEDEPDPDPLTWSDDRDEDEPDPDPFTQSDDRDEDEPDPDPLVESGGDEDDLARICRLIDDDDHGDTSWCATRLRAGVPAAGEIEESFDVDVFTFSLGELTTVSLAIEGNVVVSLFDENGYRLGSSESAKGSIARIIQTLAPGRYFVRVEAPTVARYQLTLNH